MKIIAEAGALDFKPGCRDIFNMEDSQPPCPPPLPPEGNDASARQWITVLHLSALAGLVIVGFGHILGPLIIWLLKKNEVTGLDAAGRSVLNFQISWSLWFFLSGVVAMVGSCLVVPLALPVGTFIAWLAFVINGAIKASNGVSYHFPLTIRFFS
ncbi:MAG: DUF4870 domain-containing protein [Spartobacteria bacterium]